jgi:hypothetical protein
MANSDIIIITVTLTLVSTLGVFAAIRVVNQYTRAPENTLVRSGDIELGDYIEPTQPTQVYQYPDLIQPMYNRDSFLPPSYHTIDRWYINSWLESEINLDYIFILIAFISGIIFILLLDYFKNKSSPIFTNGISKEIVTNKFKYQHILTSRIKEGDSGYSILTGQIFNKVLKHGWTEDDIKLWIEELEDQDYSVTIEIISDSPVISNRWKLYSEEFMVNYNSNPHIITQLIIQQLLSLYRSGDIDTNYKIIIYYSPLYYI